MSLLYGSLFRNNWAVHHARSNILWLDYLARKLVEEKQYKMEDKGLAETFRSFQKDILRFQTCAEFIKDGALFN